MVNPCRYFIFKIISLIMAVSFVPLCVIFVIAALPFVFVVSVHAKLSEVTWRMKNQCK